MKIEPLLLVEITVTEMYFLLDNHTVEKKLFMNNFKPNLEKGKIYSQTLLFGKL